jgi:UDP-N-acetylmuramate--alanine ligase
MDLKSLKNVYFLGIGGIGMSALARWFKANGYQVAGYDKTATPLTHSLEQEGIVVHLADDIALLPEHILQQKNQHLVVYTPAIPKNHKQYNYLIANGIEPIKRSQVLGFLTQNLYTIGVAGTHGKTTTSSMVTHLLKDAGLNVTAFLGGITQNYGTNFIVNEKPDNVICVVEADEFDRSFLTLSPDIAVVTSTDADHLDIYGSHEHVLESFSLYLNRIKSGGRAYIQENLSITVPKHVQNFSYGLNHGAYAAKNLHIANGAFVFDLQHPAGYIHDINMLVPGFHNVENAVAASAIALQLGVAPDAIKSALASFGGVKRRFEYQIKSPEVVFIDDYAHHPTEIEACLRSVKALYPNRKLTAVFQPHLYSRTADFQLAFAQSLDLADELILLDIYPARELPMPGVSSMIIFDKMNLKNKVQIPKEQLLGYLQNHNVELLVTMGAGDIDSLLPAIKKLLQKA